MTRSFSLSLDLLRVFAALAVFAAHLDVDFYGFLPAKLQNVHLGHDAVIVFFVLSGYIIYYTADTREHDPRDFIARRLGRLYSVVLPALLVTVIVDFIGLQVNPELYAPRALNMELPWRALQHVLFIQEIWWRHCQFYTAAPLWSLSYEFWYYVIFAAAFFVRPMRLKIAAVLLAMLLAGPKILLLFPAWLVGAGVYWLHRRQIAPRRFALPLVLLSLALIVLYALVYHGMMDSPVFARGIYYRSRPYLSDSVLALLLALLVWALYHVQWRCGAVLERIIRKLAAGTFALYVFHLPLLYFFTAITGFEKQGTSMLWAVIAGPLVTSYLLAEITEKRKGAWQRWFRRRMG